MKTIDIQAKEWFDSKNCNSYFSAKVTIDYGMETEAAISIPFQYGYGDQYKHVAFKALQKAGYIECAENVVFWKYYYEQNITANHSIKTKCLKREVINWGNL